MMSTAAQRALSIARRARGGRQRFDDGGQTDQPAGQQPEASPQQSNAYITSMTQPMGANVGSYAAESGYNAAAGLQNANWQNPPAGGQQGAPPPPSGGGGGPQAGAPMPNSMPAAALPPAVPQPTQPPPPGTVSRGQPSADVSPQLSAALLRALKIGAADQEQRQPAQPTQGAQPVINAGGKNTVSQPGQIDAQGNEIEPPSARRVQDAIKNTADLFGISDKLRQMKIRDAVNAAASVTNPVSSLIGHGIDALRGQQPAGGTPPQPNAQPQPNARRHDRSLSSELRVFIAKYFHDSSPRYGFPDPDSRFAIRIEKPRRKRRARGT